MLLRHTIGIPSAPASSNAMHINHQKLDGTQPSFQIRGQLLHRTLRGIRPASLQIGILSQRTQERCETALDEPQMPCKFGRALPGKSETARDACAKGSVLAH